MVQRKKRKTLPGRKQPSSVWAKLLAEIPGYDPFRDSAGCEFRPEKAKHPIDFFETCLQHIKGEHAGKPLVLARWQKAILANLFGWVRADGTRRYRECLIFIPRKNTKSTLAAGIANYLLFCDGEEGAEIYCAAAERKQAALVFDLARQMVLREPVLSREAKVFSNAITIEHMASTLQAISAEAGTKHGFNPHGVIVDELHAQPNRDLVDVLMTGTGARRQPLVIHITTSDFDRESICNEKHEYACKVRDGIIADPSFLPVIYEATIDDDWKNPDVWKKANPALGDAVTLEYLQRECKRAEESPAYENTFKRLHLNIRTEQDVRWLALEKWDSCVGDHGETSEEVQRGSECYGGLDLASTTDVAAFALMFPGESGRYSVIPYFWIPEKNAHERERRDRVPYLTWARQGFLEMTPGNVIDFDRIRARIVELGKIFNIKEIAVDRWNAAHIMTDLAGDGFEIVQFGQGFKDMTSPTKELEMLVLSERLAHGGNPVLRWMASNVSVETDAVNNMKPSKKRSTERIDGIVAMIMGLGRAMVQGCGSSEPAFIV